MNHRLRALSALVVAVGLAAVAPAQAKKGKPDNAPRATLEHYNLGKNVAIQGYDPVAYFPEGGGKPKKGNARFSKTYKGVVYRFANKKHLELFAKTPARFEPAYGGWCAYAMRDGNKVEVDAESFLVQNGRLMLFYNGFFNNTRKSWSRGNTSAQEKKADGRWKKISGEVAPKQPARKGQGRGR